MNKPRLAEALGVEVNEHFKIKGCSCEFEINENGDLIHTEAEVVILNFVLARAINNPEDNVIHLPKWTQQDIDDAKYLRRFFPSARTVWRDTNPAYGVNVVIVENDSWDIRILNEDCFPSLRKKEEAKLDDILKAGVEE